MTADRATDAAAVEERLQRTIASVFGVDADGLTDESSPATIPSWDSLNHLNLVMAIEEEFGISLTPDEAAEMRDVGQVRAVLQRSGVSVGVKLTVVDCQPHQISDLREFFARSYGPGYRLATDEALLRWQYGPTPASPELPGHLKLALLDGRIVGCLGYIPVEVSLDSGIFSGAWVANWMTDPDQRGLGLGPILMREVTRQFDVALDLGANAEALDLLSRMGWSDLGDLPRYVCVLDQAQAARLTATGRLVWPAPPPAGGPRSDVRRVKLFDAGATTLWDRTWGVKSAGGTRRSAEFLNWRYAGHPVFQYRLFEEHRNGRLAGLAVYHVEEVRDLPVRVGRLVELITEPGPDGSLLNGVVSDARSMGVAVMDFFCASQRMAGLLARNGFLPAETEPEARIPLLFQPLDRRRAGIRFMHNLGSAAEAGQVRDWYVTKSDGDQDRPN
jgi:acyl carrier protein